MVLLARRRISFATFLKLRLSPSVVVASSSALKAMIFVWSEMLSMIFAISQMELIFSLSFLIPWIVMPVDSAMDEIESKDLFSSSEPSFTFSTVFFAISVTSMILFSMLWERFVAFSIVETISLIPVDCSTEVDSVSFAIRISSDEETLMVFPNCSV